MSSKNTQAYEAIKARLLSCHYVFGDPISVKELTEETGISRQPIMTALYRLQEQGFVEITAQVGSRVVQPTLSTILDFYQMFAAIEGVLARLAAQRIHASNIQVLHDINLRIAALKTTNPDFEQHYRELNIQFHLALHELAQAPLVSTRQQANFDLSDFYLVQTQSLKENLKSAFQEHQDLINAINNKNALLAEQLAHDHIMSVADKLKSNWKY